MISRQRIVVVALALLAAAAVVIPLLLVGIKGMGTEGSLSFSLFKEVFGSSYYKRVLYFTFFQAVASSIVTLLLGIPGAYVLSNYKFRGKRHLLALTSVPFVLPSVLVVLGFVIFFGNTGIVNSVLAHVPGFGDYTLRILYNWKAIVLAHAFYNIPLVYRIVSSVWTQIDERMLEAAQNLGASRKRIFIDIELPHLRHAILSASLLTFIYSFTSFAIVLALGGPQYATVEVTIYTLTQFRGELGLSSVLAVFQLAALSLVVWAYAKVPTHLGGQGRKSLLSFSKVSGKAKGCIVFYFTAICIFLFGPLIGIGYESISSQTGITLQWFREIATGTAGYIGTSPKGAIVLSVGIGILAMGLAVVLAIIVAYSLQKKKRNTGIFNVITMAPLCISTLTLALGYVILGTMAGIDIRLAAIVIIHAMIGFPFALRSIYSSIAKMDMTLVEAAQNLGASRLRTFFTIDLPIIRGGVIAACIFSFAISLGELAATYMIGGGAYTTIPVYIYRYIGGYRIGPAAAMGVILMAVSATSFFVIDRLGSNMDI